MTHLSACGIVAVNYIAFALVLADSFFSHHPDGSLTILVIDDEERQVQLPDSRIIWRRLSDMGLDPIEIHRLAGIYDVTELATAVKPLLLRRLLDEGHSTVVYLDPDVCVYGPLDEVVPLAIRHGIVLTPHTMAPMPKGDGPVDDLYILAAGVYNLGFIAVGQGSRPFLDWWWQSTRRQALVDVQRQMFTDQRWIDFVPALFSHHLLKDPGYNVAYWNLHARRVVESGHEYLVDGRPLRFFHFSGFEPERPWLLSRHQGSAPRVLLSQHPALARLCKGYAETLLEREDAATSTRPYRWQTSAGGLELTGRVRRLYRDGLTAAERDQDVEPPDPFDAEHPTRFTAWLNAPSLEGPRGVSRYLYSIYCDRSDLRLAFRDVHGIDAAAFLDWVWSFGVREELIPLDLLPARNLVPGDQNQAPLTMPSGINFFGHAHSPMALRQVTGLLARAATEARIPHSTMTCGGTADARHIRLADMPVVAAPYDVHVLCMSAEHVLGFVRDVGLTFLEGRHTVAYWLCDGAPLPAAVAQALDYVDEVWTATDDMAQIVRAHGRKPVFTVPVPLAAPAVDSEPTRAQVGLPDRFIFLSVVDFRDDIERTQPAGLIDAFTTAFSRDEGPMLVMVCVNGRTRLPDLERLRLAATRPDVMLIDRDDATDVVDALIAACDGYVSTRPLIDFDLSLAQAMTLGKIVVTVGPDVTSAAGLLREVWTQPAEARRRGQQERARVFQRHDRDASVDALTRRVEQVRQGRQPTVES